MKKEVELKPCPFCGGEAEIWHRIELGYCTIFCLNCKARIQKNYDNETIQDWNRRADQEKAAPLFSCCEQCEDGKKGSFSDKSVYNMNFCPNCGRKL